MPVMTNGKTCCFSSCAEDIGIKTAQGWRELTAEEIVGAGMAGYEQVVSPLNVEITANGTITFTPPSLDEAVTKVDYKVEAQAALDKSDLVALRCFKNGVPFPAEWATYCAALRAIVVSGVGPLPTQPTYPQGS